MKKMPLITFVKHVLLDNMQMFLKMNVLQLVNTEKKHTLIQMETNTVFFVHKIVPVIQL